MNKTSLTGGIINGECLAPLKPQLNDVTGRTLKSVLRASAAAAILSLPGHSVQAAAYDWIGATNSTWDSGWTGGSVPTTSDDLTILGPSNAPGALTIDVFANASAKSISFTDTSTVGLANTSGADRTLTIQSGLTTAAGAVTIGSTTANQGVLVALGANQTWNIGSGGLTANNTISGTGFGITKGGSGTLTLSGANTYTGTNTLNAGTLKLDGSTGTMAATAIAGNGGTFVYDNTSSSGAKILTLGAVTASTGSTTISNVKGGATTSQITVASNTRSTGATLNYVLSGAGASVVATSANSSNRGIFLNGSDYVIQTNGSAISAPVYGTGGTSGYSKVSENSGNVGTSGSWLVDQNASLPASLNGATLKFNGSYTITQPSAGTVLTITGILVTGVSAAVINPAGASSVRVNTGGGDIVIRTDTSSDSLVINSNVVVTNSSTTANTAITKSGAGTLTFSGTGNNNYGGNTYVNEGTLISTKNTGLGFGGTVGNTTLAVGMTSVVGGAKLVLSGSSSAMVVNEPITLSGGNLENDSTANPVTLESGIAGISFANGGSGYTGTTLTFSGGGGGSGAAATYVQGSGIITSITTTNAGSGYTSAPTVTGTGGTGLSATVLLSSLSLNGEDNTIGGIGNLTINAVVADDASSGGFSKTGNGTLTMNGINTYTGSTTVTAGTLLVSGGLTATSALAVSGGTLRLGASDALNNGASLTLSGGTLSTGATTGFSETLGTLDLNTAGTLTLALGTGVHSLNFANSSAIDWTGSTLTITGWTGTAGSSGTAGRIFFGNSASGLTAGQLSQINFSGYANGATILSTGEIVAVPEPATWALLAFSLTAVIVLRRRRIG